MTEISFVWAEDLDGWIGKNHDLPWNVPADLKHFKEVTLGHPIVMGKTTYDSIGRPLPKRTNIVLTHQTIDNDKVLTFDNVDDLMDWIEKSGEAEVAIIGGARVFDQMMPQATVLYRTVINGHYDGDTKMPPLDYEQWHMVDRQPVEENGETICWFEKWILDEK
ncbi:MAG: dihydrofolate reductase [Limosilactobacillus sp.]|uniref:dihydrofolate reductase n=1 Tax=Limosilactobacillus sp. TaxID=2773925 RepID=UPI00270B1BBA|nr:dihydrofolate reductase [Limosilactobacillus sp.]